MNFLIITGEMAEQDVRCAAGSFADILVVPVPVASLITPSVLLNAWKKSQNLKKKYDVALISGFSTIDFSSIEPGLGFPVRLGPKNAADLSLIKEIPLSLFSKKVPVCIHIKELKQEKAAHDIITYEEKASFSFLIRNVKIGKKSRMKVLYEIVDAHKLSLYDLKCSIKDGIADGADMIDLGFSPDADPVVVYNTVKFALSVSSVPISADSISPIQIY